jgi:hypothetical protein
MPKRWNPITKEFTFNSTDSGFVPYTGAVSNLDLGVFEIYASNLSGVNTGDEDELSFTVSDDLSGLLHLRISAGGKIEQRYGI